MPPGVSNVTSVDKTILPLHAKSRIRNQTKGSCDVLFTRLKPTKREFTLIKMQTQRFSATI